MASNYSKLLASLYEEFGDDIKDLGKDFVHSQFEKARVSVHDPQGRCGAKENQEVKENLDSKKSSSTPSDEVQEAQDPEIVEEDASNVNDENSYYDADAFEEKTILDMQSQSVSAVLNSQDAVAVIGNLVSVAAEVRRFEEAQITVRTDIAAQRDIALAKIEAQKEALMVYLEKSFDERKEGFLQLFSVVDNALKTDNMQSLALGLEGIIKLADSSPFKNLQSVEQAASAFADPDHEWDF